MQKPRKLALVRETLRPLERTILATLAGGPRIEYRVQHSVATTSSYDGGCTTGCGSGSGTVGTATDVSG